MQAFRYQHGDRPLEGFTIQRAIGRGGFGEVYYALSDSGREVALKVIQGYEQIELRGVSQCMNLKSPHLVTIFDVRHNEQGVPFVIMEYVAGPSLRELIDESPKGLGAQKTAFFLREIAKGLTYLHERGIVHRDMKPGNIFYEDGYVKIGDYGLSKAMTASQHSGQTITVGTVHYMAPEIGQGRYDASIDLYALGCVLYEMLTGQTPFLGTSPGEILMKHIASEPDMSGVEEPFATVIRKALAKNPADRFSSAQEMVEAVFGTEQIRNSVSVFQPASLSMVAERVGRKVVAGGPGSSADHTGATIGQPAQDAGEAGSLQHVGRRLDETRDRVEKWFKEGGMSWETIGRHMDQAGQRIAKAGGRLGERMGELGSRIGTKAGGSPDASATPAAAPSLGSNDPLNWNQRRLLGILAAAAIAIGTTAVSQVQDTPLMPLAVALFLIIGGAAGGLVAVRFNHLAKLRYEDPIIKQLAFVLCAALMVSLFLLPAFLGSSPRNNMPAAGPMLVLLLVPLILLISYLIRRSQSSKRVADAGRLIYMLPLLVASIALMAMASTRPEHGEIFQIEMLAPLLGGAPALLLVKWRMLTSPLRPDRLGLWAAVWAAFVGYVIARILDGSEVLSAGILAGIVLVAQILAPWDPITGREQKKRQQAGRPLLDEDDVETARLAGGVAPHGTQGSAGPASGDAAYATTIATRDAFDRPPTPALSPDKQQSPFSLRIGLLLWLIITGSLCPTLICTSVVGRFHIHDQGLRGLFMGLGIGSGLFALFCIQRLFQRSYRGLWDEVFKPMLVLLCITSLLGTWGYLLTTNRLTSEEMTIMVFVSALTIIIGGITVFFKPGRIPPEMSAFARSAFTPPPVRVRSIASSKFRLYALLLSLMNFFPFIPLAGLHRFYVGKPWTGILYLVTFGLLSIGTIIDIIRIAMGTFRDAEGKPLLAWRELSELSDAPAPVTTAPGAAGFSPHGVSSGPATTEIADAARAEARGSAMPVAHYPEPSVSRSAHPRHLLSLSLSIVAFFVGGSLTVLTAFKTPELIAAGWPDPSLTRAMDDAFDRYPEWPKLLWDISRIAAVACLLAGGMLLMLARRGSSFGHFARAGLGMLALMFAGHLAIRHFADLRWSGIAQQWNQNEVIPGLAALFEQLQAHNGPPLVAMLLLIIVGLSLLIWPQRHLEEGHV